MKYIILLIFIAVPVAEIAAFIQVGSLIGLWPTLATVVLTAVIGTAMIRQQGLQTIAQAQGAIEQGRTPVDSVVDGIFLLVSALLLLTPGFITDAVGFALLIRPLRMNIARRIWHYVRVSGDIKIVHPDQPNPHSHGPIIDGELVDLESDADDEPDKPPTKPGSRNRSPWRNKG